MEIFYFCLDKPYKKYGYTPKIDVYNYFWYGYKRVSTNNRKMTMERIQIYTRQKGFKLFFKISGILSFILGLTGLIISYKEGFKTAFFGGNWNYYIFTIQGIMFFLMGHTNKRNDKYFIEWNETELRYLLPKNKCIETINLSEIRNVSVKLYEIKLQLLEIEKTLNLENIHFKEFKKIKEKYEEIKKNTDKRKEI